MSNPFDNDNAGERIVYVRSVKTEDVPEAREQGVTAEELYAIHDESGNRLAVVTDRSAAFVVARQNALHPVSVH
jgi:hypothetical protein